MVGVWCVVLLRGGRPVFVFPGQGAQWEGMAVELLGSSGMFRERLRLCGVALEEFVDWRVEDVLCGVEGAPGLDRVDVVQPVSFAVMVALAGLWESFGVRPGVVVGHSQGEIAAACVAGGLSLVDAARVVVLRSRLLGEVLAGRGGMVSVALGVEEVERQIEGWGGRLSVAAVNGPSVVVVSGESGALDELLVACEGDGVWARRVAVDYASHSAAVEELREGLVEALEGIEPVSCGVPFFSTATGEFLDTARLDGEYWYRSLRERVRFEEATRALAGDACVFIEVSPHPVLGVALSSTLEDMGLDERVGVVGSLRRGEGGLGQFVESLAEAWVVGAPVDWGVFFEGSGARRVDLPRYAFQRERYWLARVGVWVMCGVLGWGCRIIRCLVRRFRLRVVRGGCSPAGCAWIRMPGSRITRYSIRCCCPARGSSSWCWRPGGWLGVWGWGSSRCRRRWCWGRVVRCSCRSRLGGPGMMVLVRSLFILVRRLGLGRSRQLEGLVGGRGTRVVCWSRKRVRRVSRGGVLRGLLLWNLCSGWGPSGRRRVRGSSTSSFFTTGSRRLGSGTAPRSRVSRRRGVPTARFMPRSHSTTTPRRRPQVRHSPRAPRRRATRSLPTEDGDGLDLTGVVLPFALSEVSLHRERAPCCGSVSLVARATQSVSPHSTRPGNWSSR